MLGLHLVCRPGNFTRNGKVSENMCVCVCEAQVSPSSYVRICIHIHILDFPRAYTFIQIAVPRVRFEARIITVNKLHVFRVSEN